MDNNQDKIDSYIRHELTSGEIEDFEKSLNSNTILKSDFELTLLISKSLKKRASLYKRMSQWEVELGQKESRKLSLGHIKRIIITGIAASIIIAIIIIVPFYNKDIIETNDNYASNIPSFDSSDFLSNDYKMYTAQIDSLINVSEYEKAMSLVCLVEKDFETVKPNTNNEFEKAGLENTGISRTEKYLNDAYVLRWRKINLLLALGDKDKALSELNDYKNEEGKFKEKANKLYRELTISENIK